MKTNSDFIMLKIGAEYQRVNYGRLTILELENLLHDRIALIIKTSKLPLFDYLENKKFKYIAIINSDTIFWRLKSQYFESLLFNEISPDKEILSFFHYVGIKESKTQ